MITTVWKLELIKRQLYTAPPGTCTHTNMYKKVVIFISHVQIKAYLFSLFWNEYTTVHVFMLIPEMSHFSLLRRGLFLCLYPCRLAIQRLGSTLPIISPHALSLPFPPPLPSPPLGSLCGGEKSHLLSCYLFNKKLYCCTLN